MKYIVDVKEVYKSSVPVEADSVEEAKEKAEELYYNGRINWEDPNVTYVAKPMERLQGRDDAR